VAADIEAETARIARRYGLSNEQAEKVRVILDEHAALLGAASVAVRCVTLRARFPRP